jgi:iron only hydrogenase large subunit-like protein
VSKCLANAALADGNKLIAQISQAFISALEREYAFAAGTITTGKMTAALKFLGFDKVYDAAEAANFSNAEISGEVHARKNKSGSGKQPVITGCSEGIGNFVRNFYPDLAANLITEKTPRRIFTSLIKNGYAKEAGLDSSKITTVSFVPCLAQKYAAEQDKTDFAITAPEIARIIKSAGIMIETLQEKSFDTINTGSPKQDNSVRKMTVNGFAKAHKIMETIRKGECDVDWVEILSCPGDCAYTFLQ